MNRTQFISFLFTYIIDISAIHAQNFANKEEFDPEPRGDHGLRIMFYNVENLFDTFDDPISNDEEFTSNGEKSWNHYRYREKLNNIAKTIIAVGGWEPPDLVGLCEIENFQVLHDLLSKTPLNKFGYQIIHENSRDARGIDNAILFLPDKLEKIYHRAIQIDTDGKFKTRDILHASFSFQKRDTIHFLVNHWPSRYGGKAFTASKRLPVANSLRQHLDNILSQNPNVKLFVMGDFNDEPDDKSILYVFKALPLEQTINSRNLYNLSYEDFRNGKGTITYKEIDYTWFLFDQMIVTGSLLNGIGLVTKGMKFHIFDADWLLQKGKPYRTFQGPIYKGGFSDHLPIFIDLYYGE